MWSNSIATPRETFQSRFVVSYHKEEIAPQVVRLQFLLVVKAEHELAEIGAVLLEHVLTVHLDDREQLHASCANSVARRSWQTLETSPYQLACTQATTEVTQREEPDNARIQFPKRQNTRG